MLQNFGGDLQHTFLNPPLVKKITSSAIMLSGLPTTYLYGQTNDTPFVLHTTKKIDSKGTSLST